MEQEDPTLTKESLLAAKQWLEEQKEIIPKDVIFCLVMLIDNMLKGEGSPLCQSHLRHPPICV